MDDQAVPWRITHKNQNYELCDTYPAVVSPSSMAMIVHQNRGWVVMNAPAMACFPCSHLSTAGSSQISHWWWTLSGGQFQKQKQNACEIVVSPYCATLLEMCILWYFCRCCLGSTMWRMHPLHGAANHLLVPCQSAMRMTRNIFRWTACKGSFCTI